MTVTTLLRILALGFLSLTVLACKPHVAEEGCATMNAADCQAEGAADAGPLPYTLYVRGGFNGWNAENPFSYEGNAVYRALVHTAPGNHEFKLAPNDWREEWVLDKSDTKPAELGVSYPLKKGGGGSHLFIRRSGYFVFTLDMSQPQAPTLIVTETEGPAAEQVDPHAAHQQRQTIAFNTYDGKQETVIFSVDRVDSELRDYAQSTTQALRDPDPNYVRYQEQAGYPRVRSGNLAFDALFALSLHEMRQDSVSQIVDGNYNNGESIACDCFETGAKWHYVWTRDLSYAAYLALAMLDPERVRNSLEFKMSGYRAGVTKPAAVPGSADGLQIVQDTGSGGSWPISTDRMTWAFGAEKTLQNLSDQARRAFLEKAYRGLSNTIEIDRVAAFDGVDGLYRGEQSFLDWREQTYASWIVDDIASLGTSKSLSTNVGHFQALRLASSMARELGDGERGDKYSQWAADLKSAINTRLWLDDAGMYSSMTAGHFDGAPLQKYDWLGLSLAVITGVAEGERARQALANYPHGPMGAPVIFPQQPEVPVYHNRAIWPFVSAYGLKAATLVGNSAVADAAYTTLIRAAALNLSNMENLEWLSGQPLLLDENRPELSGPVINSKRQLWSVAGYLGMVIESVFGLTSDARGLHVQPFITAGLRNSQFARSARIALYDLSLRGHRLDVSINLPPAGDREGYYRVARRELNGQAVDDHIAWSELGEHDRLEITLGALERDQQGITRVNADPYAVADPAVYAPLEPSIDEAGVKNGIASLQTDDRRNSGELHYLLYKNGTAVRQAKRTGPSADPLAAQGANCYALAAVYSASNTVSHHSVPRCTGSAELIAVGDPRLSSSVASVERDGLRYLPAWGAAGDSLKVAGVNLNRAGRYALQLRYNNHSNAINLGISNGVKWLEVKDAAGKTVAAGVVQMPHSRDWAYSSPLEVQLPRGEYQFELSDFINMSYLQSNTSFAQAGGGDGPVNRFDLAGLRVLPVAGQ